MLMENGLLQEIGTHQQLLARKGFYYAFTVSKMPQSTDPRLITKDLL